METSIGKERHSSWLENFYDLIVTIVVSQLIIISHDVSLNGFVDFVILFIPVWWSWIGVTFYNTRFDTDDLGHRLLTLLQMAAAAFMAISVPNAFLSKNSAGFAISYAVIRILLVIEYVRTGHSAPATRPLTKRYSIGFSIAAAFWFISAFIPPPFRFLLWAAGLVIDIATPMVFTRQLSARFAPHIYHLPERFGSFTIIVLGIAILGFVDGIAEEHNWSIQSISESALGLGIAFSLWWVYFDSIDGSVIKALRRDKRIGIYAAWLYIHFPLAIGFTSFGVSLEGVVLSDQHTVLPLAETMLMCGSVSLCLFSLGILQIVSSRGKALERKHKENDYLDSSIYNNNHQILEQKSTAKYSIAAAIFVIFFPILGQNLLPIFIMIVVGIACVGQVILDIKYHPQHRRFKI